jgi:hypothetical protein
MADGVGVVGVHQMKEDGVEASGWGQASEGDDGEYGVSVRGARDHEPRIVSARAIEIAASAKGHTLSVALGAVMIHVQRTEHGAVLTERAFDGFEPQVAQATGCLVVIGEADQ